MELRELELRPGVSVTLCRATVYTYVFSVSYEERFGAQFADSATLNSYWRSFTICASQTKRITGDGWQPPALTATAEQVAASFEAWMTAFSGDEITAWLIAIGEINAPLVAAELAPEWTPGADSDPKA